MWAGYSCTVMPLPLAPGRASVPPASLRRAQYPYPRTRLGKIFMKNWPLALMGRALPAIYFECSLGLTLVLPLVFSAAVAELAGPANIPP